MKLGLSQSGGHKAAIKMQGIIVIELAFLLPVFLLIVLSSVEVARFFWAQHWLNANLHLAIREEALDPGVGVQQRLNQQLVSAGRLFPAQSVTVSATPTNWFDQDNGDLIRYRAQAALKLALLPWQTFSISSTSWLSANENRIR